MVIISKIKEVKMSFIIVIAFLVVNIPISFGNHSGNTLMSPLPVTISFESISLKGKVGEYPIEMEIIEYNTESESFRGRYRYLSQSAYLNINGNMMLNCMYIEEFEQENKTAAFYLDIINDSLKGWWSDGNKSFRVHMAVTKGNLNTLSVKKLSVYSKDVNTNITGSYGVEGFWVNDYRDVEIGFNGGYAVFEELTNGLLKFQFEVISGPTYHYAIASGIARKMGSTYVYSSEGISENEPCIMIFEFSEKSVYAEANYTWHCGFGARAYLAHTFIKISNQATFGDDVSLSGIKKY